MRLNKKGEGGFMEAMVAVMAVIITLTAFLSFLALSISYDDEDDPDIPLDLLDHVHIVNGKIEADIEERMDIIINRYGYAGMRVILSTAGSVFDSSLTVNAGITESDIIRSKGGTMIVKADDGRSVPVRYLVAVWS